MADDAKRPAKLSILVVDDETIVRESLGAWLREDGHDVDTAETARRALRMASDKKYDLALLDIKMPNMDGLELQERFAQADPDITVVIMTAYASVETAVKALKAGAYDYLVKPFDPDELSHLIRRAQEHRSLRTENVRLKQSLEVASAGTKMIGTSQAMQRVMDLVRTVAVTDATVLIQGESGTGKELVAHAIHTGSPRRYNPMVIVHLGALAEGILESELFGHEKGAFTGASQAHKGKFEQADSGTIFLDEIGDITPKVQVELLRVLEEKRVTRVGGKQSIPADFRLIAATNRNLTAMVEEGSFREDVYYRLNVVNITIPPLRDRPDDILPLARHFLERIGRSMSRRDLELSPEASQALRAHRWPGNARELQNAIERAVVMTQGHVLEASALPQYVLAAGASPASAAAPSVGGGRSLSEVERLHVAAVLQETGWNISRAAAILGVDRGTLYAKIKKFGLQRPDDEG